LKLQNIHDFAFKKFRVLLFQISKGINLRESDQKVPVKVSAYSTHNIVLPCNGHIQANHKNHKKDSLNLFERRGSLLQNDE